MYVACSTWGPFAHFRRNNGTDNHSSMLSSRYMEWSTTTVHLLLSSFVDLFMIVLSESSNKCHAKTSEVGSI
jgi:hypothetical protein